jgi:hypothetical protein
MSMNFALNVLNSFICVKHYDKSMVTVDVFFVVLLCFTKL